MKCLPETAATGPHETCERVPHLLGDRPRELGARGHRGRSVVLQLDVNRAASRDARAHVYPARMRQLSDPLHERLVIVPFQHALRVELEHETTFGDLDAHVSPRTRS